MTSRFQTISLGFAALVTGLALPLLAASPAHAEDAAAAAKARAGQLARGGYLVTIASCGDCHTPLKMGPKGPEPDMARMLSGHPAQVTLPAAPLSVNSPWMWAGAATNTAFAGPWGVSYAANLTPDAATGIGGWSEQQFIAAIRNGRHLGTSRPLAPPMPWQSIGQMTDEDLRAVFAYLRNIRPVANRVPDLQPPAPVTARR